MIGKEIIRFKFCGYVISIKREVVLRWSYFYTAQMLISDEGEVLYSNGIDEFETSDVAETHRHIDFLSLVYRLWSLWRSRKYDLSHLIRILSAFLTIT